MQGVTTALVLFIFACAAFPKLVRNKPQFYIGVGLTALIIILDALRFMVTQAGESARPGAFSVFLYVILALAQFLAFVALILASGGLSIKDLADDIAGTFQAGREPDAPIAVPLTGRRSQSPDAEEQRTVYTISSPEPAPAPPPSSIPLHDEAPPPPPAPPPAPPSPPASPTGDKPPAP